MEQCVSLLSTSSGRQKFNVSFTNNFISIRDWSYRFTKYCLSLIFKSNSLLWALPIVLISSHSLSLYRRLHTFKLLTYSSHWLCPPVLNMSEHILFKFQRYSVCFASKQIHLLELSIKEFWDAGFESRS